MKPRKLNKAIDSGIDKVLNEGLVVKVSIPGETLLSLGLTIIVTTLTIVVTTKIIRKKL